MPSFFSSHHFLITTGTTTLSNIILLISISLCFFIPSNAAATTTTNTTETDLLALLSFKSLIGSDPSGALSSWNSSFHHCRWRGVTCGRLHPDRVTGLTLNSFQLDGQISSSLANLTFLQHLSLSDNHLYGNITEELGQLSRLQYLNLSINSFHGSIPSALGNNCSNLEFLDLSDNFLEQTIPLNLGQCQNLRILHLENIWFPGGIPSDFGNLLQLKELHLSENYIHGTIPSTLGNLTNLQLLDLSSNIFTGSIPDSFGQLKSLNIFQINDNHISGNVPRSLYNLSNLEKLDLGKNYLKGFLSPYICDAFQTLKYLLIYKNQFNGQIPSSLSNCTTLHTIDLSFNKFTGVIPSSLGNLQQLNFLKVNMNRLEAKTSSDWSFIHALINCTNFQYLIAGNNQLQGVIPRSFANITSPISSLILSGNPISGSIPAEFGMLTNLTYLGLDQTLLSGQIPIEIGNLWKLQRLYMSNNMLSGEIPSTFGNLTKLTELFLQNNAFEGRIAPSLGNMQSLEFLDISNNKIIGEIPREIMNVHSLSFGLNLSQNYLNGSIPSEIGELNDIRQIDLSYNNLSGQVPSTIDGCHLLQILHLEGNSLSGPIPSSLGNLEGLQDLDLSNNFLSGQVPSFVSAMELRFLNISFNDFQGELPKDGVFNNVNIAVDVRGNSKLCSGLPDNHLPKCIPDSPSHNHNSNSIKIILVCISSGFLCISIIICLVAGCYWRKGSQKDPQSITTMTWEYNKVSYNDLLKATNSFSVENLIGSGSFGVVYKASMSLGSAETVAIKVLNLKQRGAFRSFLSECEALRNVRHRNLIKILSVCSSIDHRGNDFKALIFAFMPNGSLETWLHPNAREDRSPKCLTLLQRMNVAIDIAMALDYLHDHKPVLVHCDLKPSNVLLDDDMTAHVGDFGLAQFLARPDTVPGQSITSNSGIKGSIGYIPPEYGMGAQASMQGDVFSYGILLLEIFIGIRPTDERFGDGLSLHKHVETAYPARVMDIIDTKLFSSDHGNENTLVPENSQECLVSVIRCGLLCSKEMPKERIAMTDVVKELNSARNKLLE